MWHESCENIGAQQINSSKFVIGLLGSGPKCELPARRPVDFCSKLECGPKVPSHKPEEETQKPTAARLQITVITAKHYSKSIIEGSELLVDILRGARARASTAREPAQKTCKKKQRN